MKRASTRQRRRGFALVLVMVQMALLMAFWSIANRQTGQLLQLQTALAQRERRDQGSLTALATGIGLLETGTPSSSPYSGTTGTSPSYLVTFTDLGNAQWKIDVAPASTGETASPLPSTFAPVP
jgi:hypothetical protein